MDLQLDYWTVAPLDGSSQVSSAGPGSLSESLDTSKSEVKGARGLSAAAGGQGAGGGDGGAGSKYSIKSSIWFMQIQRLGSLLSVNLQDQQQPTFSMLYRLKEKKQKSKSWHVLPPGSLH